MKKDDVKQIDEYIKKLQKQKNDMIFETNPPPLPPDFPIPPKQEKQEIEYQIKKPNNFIWYFSPVVLFILSILTPLFLWFGYDTKIYFIISLFFCIPFGIMALFMLVTRLFMDRRKIKEKIIRKVSKNYIIFNFFKDNKRITRKVLMLNPDGKSATDGNKDYTIDLDGVWYDETNAPNVFNLENLPNNLLFGFSKNITQFVRNLMEDNKNKGVYTDEHGHLVDVSYSSENLQLLKKDKIFSELHRNPESDKIIMILIGVLALSNIIWLIVFLVSRK